MSPFAGLALVVVVPVLVFSATQPIRAWEQRLSNASSAGVTAISDAGQALQNSSFDEAAANFSSAREHFAEAYAELQNAQGFVKTLLTATPIVRGKVEDGRRLLLAGQAFADAGEQLTKSLGLLVEHPANSSSDAFPLAGAFLSQAENIAVSVAEIRTALDSIAKVNPSHLPRTYRQRFVAFKERLPVLASRFSQSEQLIPFFKDFLGTSQPREYLFLFQNDAELRPGGGFIGSLALIRFDDGQFSVLDAPSQGPAAIDDNLPMKLIPPAPVLAVAPYWTMHDANWFVDFPTSASKVLWFYEQVRGFSVDGVVAMTPTVVERLLAVTGPLDLPKYGLVLTADNFLTVTQEQVELKYDKAAYQPKQFVVDLIPALLGRLSDLPANQAVPVISALEESLLSKDIFFWVKNEQQADRLQVLGWDGALPAPVGDSLAIVNANLGGGKSSRAIQQSAELEVQLAGGQIEDTLRIHLRHTGRVGDLWTGVRYRGYLKVYLPASTELIDAAGFDRLPVSTFFTPSPDAQPDVTVQQVEQNPLLEERTGTRQTKEFDRIALGNWVVLEPGDEQTIALRYRSGAHFQPQRSGRLYELTIAKQPGAQPYPLTVRFPSAAPIRLSSLPVQRQGTSARFSDTISQDRRYLVLFKP